MAGCPRIVAVVFACVVGCLGGGPTAAAEPPVDRWADDIAAFEAADQETPPALGGVLFVGSSSIRKWDLARWFPGLTTLNRGFGGSQIADVNRYAERIVLPYRPKAIVFYSGDNDINAGKTPAEVESDLQQFVSSVHDSLPQTSVLVISIKPSLKRREQVAQQQQANERFRTLCESDRRLTYIDIVPLMLGEDGQPRPDLFVDDGLHLSDAGYRLWTEIVGEALARE